MELSHFKWFVVQTAPRQEAVAAWDLRRRGYQALFLHTAEWKERGKSKSVLVKRPWFVGYIFVGLSPEQFVDGVPMLHDVTNAIGVSRNGVVCMPGGRPMAIPVPAIVQEWDIDPISGQVRDQTQAPVFQGKPGWRLKLGNGAGPYWGVMAEIQRIDPSGKLYILIESFGRRVLTTVRQDQVDEIISPGGKSISTVQTG